MPKAVKSQASRKQTQPISRAARISTRAFKAGQTKLLDSPGISLAVADKGAGRTTLKPSCSEVPVENEYSGIKSDPKDKLIKFNRRSLSDSSVAGISHGLCSGYSSTVLKVESFDLLHRLLNVCCKTASFDVLDVSKILQHITPEIMNTVVKMLGENIVKGSDHLKGFAQSYCGLKLGDTEKTSESMRIVRNDSEDSSSLELIQPRQSSDGSTSSSLSTAVDVLMSLTAEKAQNSNGKGTGCENVVQGDDGKSPKPEERMLVSDVKQTITGDIGIQSDSAPLDQTMSSRTRALSSGTQETPSELISPEGVIDVTDAVFKGDMLTTTTAVTVVTTHTPSVIDPFASSDSSNTLSQWAQPFQYGVTRGAGGQEKSLPHDDLNLLPNIQSILNPVSPLSGVPEMSLSISGAFPPLACEGSAGTVKGDHLVQPGMNLGQRKTNLRTILPKPAAGDPNLRTATSGLPVQPLRSIEHITTSGVSIPLATFIPTMSYAEQTTANSGVTIKQLPLLTANPLLINQNNFCNILNTLGGPSVIYDPTALCTVSKGKEGHLLSTSSSTMLSSATILDKSALSLGQVHSQTKGKHSTISLPGQLSGSQGTSVTYAGELKGKQLPDQLLGEAVKEDMRNPPQKTEKGSNLEAASALLSMGSRNKDSKNGHQVVTGFNRQRHTFDIEEQSLGHRGDILFTSTGTFQIEDIEIDPKKNKIEKDNYACGKCGRVFTSIIYLARHIKRVCPDMSHRKWKCDRCEKAFRHPFGLQQHIYTHTGERPYKCEQCAKAFYSANDLRRHKRTHSGERPYRCSHCDKAFSTTISLKTHTYIHTGERPHKCPVCGKTFATSSKLSRHVVTHSDQRPFACDLCPKTFNRSGDLRRHYNHVHQQEHGLMECDECNKVFATSKCLLHHKGTHNRDRPQDKGQALVADQQSADLKEE